jgi:hypothetical protein
VNENVNNSENERKVKMERSWLHNDLTVNMNVNVTVTVSTFTVTFNIQHSKIIHISRVDL